MAEEPSRPIRLMSFVSEEQLDEAKKARGERVEDGTAQRDRPLFEILKENKDKKDAEFNERFKHRPPKALDDDETEFLEKVEMSRREYEQQIADEEAQQLQSFQEQKSIGRKNMPARPLGMIIKVKPQAKKARLETGTIEQLSEVVKIHAVDAEKSSEPLKKSNSNTSKSQDVGISGLVSYSDESEEDD
ncbi:hypothetical protein ACB098_10G136900 [Castanea mollissima]